MLLLDIETHGFISIEPDDRPIDPWDIVREYGREGYRPYEFGTQ
jgi:hypothetical protein